MTAAVVALLADVAAARELGARFEEEGVPLSIESRAGAAFPLAREAARGSPLGLGIGGDSERLVLVLAAGPGRPYVTMTPDRARAFGQAAARLAAGRPPDQWLSPS